MAERKVKIKFTENYKVKSDEKQSYTAGAVYEVNASTAAHFINRRVAVEHIEKDEKPVIKPKFAKPVDAPKVEQPNGGNTLQRSKPIVSTGNDGYERAPGGQPKGYRSK